MIVGKRNQVIRENMLKCFDTEFFRNPFHKFLLTISTVNIYRTQMIFRIKRNLQQYPQQFWLIAFGMLFGTIGTSMIWPFLMIYVSEKLNVGLAVVASLVTINAITNLVFSFVAGPVTDKLGRKWVMVISLAGNGLCYLFLSFATSLSAFAILMALRGVFNPLYQVGTDAMVADIIQPEKRAEGYSVLRMSNNLGVAIGPAIGGFVTSASYSVAFYLAAAGLLIYSLLLIFKAKETLIKDHSITAIKERFGGYGQVLKDKPFIQFNAIYALTFITAAMVWVLMAVYLKQNFGINEKNYGFIPTTNAIMVVTLQILITRQTKKHNALPMMAFGAAFYAAAAFMIAFGRGFWFFWLAMVVMTFGELIMVPTATTFSANLAPAAKRGRYMSVHGMTNGISSGIGPLLGGALNDSISPQAPWLAGGFISTVSVAFYALLYRNQKHSNRMKIPD